MNTILRELANRQANLFKRLAEGPGSDGSSLLRDYAYLGVSKEGVDVMGMTQANAADLAAADETAHSIPFTISSYKDDRDGDVVIPLGCDLTDYRPNPVVFFGHQGKGWELPIGVSRNPGGDITVWPEENRIRAVCYFDVHDEKAMIVEDKVRRKFLNGASIAFVPYEGYRRAPEHKAVTARPNMMPLGYVFKRYGLTEWSVVGVPSNAGAIRDMLDTEKMIPPDLRAVFKQYAAIAKGNVFTGWCCTPEGCAPCEVINKADEPPAGRPDNVKLPKWRMRSEEVITAGFPKFVSNPDDRELLEQHAKTELQAWREAVAAHNSMESLGAKLRHRPALEAAHAALKRRFDSITAGGDKGGGTCKPGQTAAQTGCTPAKEYEPRRWNKQLSDAFEPESEPLPPSVTLYDWAAKYLECPVKSIHQSSVSIPHARMGTFLTGLKHALAVHKLIDTRNIHGRYRDGAESPPKYETIRLNSKSNDSFLVEGTQFWREGVLEAKALNGTPRTRKFILTYEPNWGGLNITACVDQQHVKLLDEVFDTAWTWAKQNNFLKNEAFALSGEFLSRTDEDWPDVILEEHNSKVLRRVTKLFNEKQGNFANRGLVFLGPPGTGKTLSGRIIRNQAKGTFIWVSSRDFHKSGSFGGISLAFEMARELAPSVIFIEDVDNWLGNTTIDLLKTEMDGIARSKGVLTILTTNFPESLPEALIDRPGRFHDVLSFANPTEDARKQMIEKWLPPLSEVSIADAVERTKGYSGAHVYELCQFAKTLTDYDDVPLPEALQQALSKIEEQKELITAIQLRGSRYNAAGVRMYGLGENDFAELLPADEPLPKVVRKGKGGCGCDDCKEGKECPCGKHDKAATMADMEGPEPTDVHELQEKYIRHEGSKWVVHAEDGKVLGSHDTEEDALAQLRAVEANKHKDLSTTSGAAGGYTVEPTSAPPSAKKPKKRKPYKELRLADLYRVVKSPKESSANYQDEEDVLKELKAIQNVLAESLLEEYEEVGLLSEHTLSDVAGHLVDQYQQKGGDNVAYEREKAKRSSESNEEEAREHGTDEDTAAAAKREHPEDFEGKETPEEEEREQQDIDNADGYKHGAKVLANLHAHSYRAKAYIGKECGRMDNEKLRRHLESSNHHDKAMEHYEKLFKDHYPDHDMDAVKKALGVHHEQDDADDEVPDTTTGEESQTGDQRDNDPNRDEIHERYETPPENRKPANQKKGLNGQVQKGYFDVAKCACVKSAAEHMDDLVKCDDMPRHRKDGLRFHAAALHSFHKELTGPDEQEPSEDQQQETPMENAVEKDADADAAFEEALTRFERRVTQMTGIPIED